MAEKDNEYQKFFKSAMKKFGIESPEDFKSESEKKKFFDYVDKNWKGKKESVSKVNSLILRNSSKLNSKWDKKMNKLTEKRLRKIVNRLVEEQLNEYFELDKLEDAIKLFQDKIKKQGRITNARDEEHLEKLIKVYKEMGGKNIKMVKEVIAKQKLREGIEDNPDIAAAIYWFSYDYAAGMGNLYQARTKTGYKPSRLANNVEYEDSIVQDMYQELVDNFENDDPTYEEMLQVLEPYDDGEY